MSTRDGRGARLQVRRARWIAHAPQSLEETCLGLAGVADLALRFVYFNTGMTAQALCNAIARYLGVPLG